MTITIFTCILSSLTLVFSIILLIRLARIKKDDSIERLSAIVSTNQKQIGQMQSERFNEINRTMQDMNAVLDRRLNALRSETNIQLERLRKENAEQLSHMRNTVDEKLQETLESRITKSFKAVNDRLEQVYKGLGEMQGLARNVGDLKKVFSNVKSRGIIGEVQLGAILADTLAPEQYAENIATIPNSKNVVEFAIRLPDHDGGITYLPIDSKFPADTYGKLQHAAENGNKQLIEAAAKELRQRLLGEAKDIHQKYVFPPYTTDFAIMFLPSEGLYAEAINRGLVEELQNTYKISIAGPSTMAAMLSSIRMGFKTLAIEKRSAEVWEVLGAVKTEFNKFSTILNATQKRINQANDELDKLIGVRTRAIVRQLSSVEQLDNASDYFEEDEDI